MFPLLIIYNIVNNEGDNDDITSSEYTSPSKKEIELGLGLDLTRAEGRSYKDDNNGYVYFNNNLFMMELINDIVLSVQEDNITVVFDLPDGSQDEVCLLDNIINITL